MGGPEDWAVPSLEVELAFLLVQLHRPAGLLNAPSAQRKRARTYQRTTSSQNRPGSTTDPGVTAEPSHQTAAWDVCWGPVDSNLYRAFQRAPETLFRSTLALTPFLGCRSRSCALIARVAH